FLTGHWPLATSHCLARQKIPEAMRDLRLAFFDVAHPSGGRVSRPSEQIAFREDQEYRLAADLRPMTALLFQQPQKSAELGKVGIDLRYGRRGVDGQDQGVGIQNRLSERAIAAVGIERAPASQQLVRH